MDRHRKRNERHSQLRTLAHEPRLAHSVPHPEPPAACRDTPLSGWNGGRGNAQSLQIVWEGGGCGRVTWSHFIPALTPPPLLCDPPPPSPPRHFQAQMGPSSGPQHAQLTNPPTWLRAATESWAVDFESARYLHCTRLATKQPRWESFGHPRWSIPTALAPHCFLIITCNTFAVQQRRQ